MRKASPILVTFLAVSIAAMGILAGAARADLLGSLVKGGIVAVLIKQFNRPINDAINKLTGSAGAPISEATKVVPIVSIGQGGYVGAAQVSGPQYLLDKVQSVGMLEGGLNGNQFRLRALIPIGTLNPNKNQIQRIKGVGVSAIVDIRV